MAKRRQSTLDGRDESTGAKKIPNLADDQERGHFDVMQAITNVVLILVDVERVVGVRMADESTRTLKNRVGVERLEIKRLQREPSQLQLGVVD